MAPYLYTIRHLAAATVARVGSEGVGALNWKRFEELTKGRNPIEFASLSTASVGRKKR
jgi:hypothetical protein